MGQTLKRYWQKSVRNKVIIVLSVALLIFLAGSIIGGYTGSHYFSWVGVHDYTPPPGLSAAAERGKTLWDWLDLLIIPIILAILAAMFSRIESERVAKREELDREFEQDRQMEAALQTYLDRMTELILEKGLRSSKGGSADKDEAIGGIQAWLISKFSSGLILPSDTFKVAQDIARVRTLTVLRQLDSKRKGLLLRFLHESKLIQREQTIILLNQADLTGADLNRASLSWANLRGVDLSQAKLKRAYLARTDLSQADLTEAELARAHLKEVMLQWTNLTQADLNEADLQKAHLEYAKLNGTKLIRANLAGADLKFAKLIGADLTEADLTEANLQGTEFNNDTKWPTDFNPNGAGAKKI